MDRDILITAKDYERLRKLIAEEREFGKSVDPLELKALEQELDRAVITRAEDIPSDIITMNSEFVLEDLDSGDETTYSLVYPEDADFLENRISIIAPVGTAIIGYRQGDEIKWRIPSGTARLKIKKVMYQPEASGDFEL